MNLLFSRYLVVLSALLASAVAAAPVARAQSFSAPIDARYAPIPSFSLLCYPDDPLKTVVTDRGELGYDFGPGPYARPLTRIGISLVNDSVTVQRQWLDDPRVPIVRTALAGRTGSLATRALSWGGPQRLTDRHGHAIGYRRIGGENGCIAWADPASGNPRELRNVAWGTNRPINYRIGVPRGKRRRVALGFCESYKPSPKSRLVEIRVEGAPHRTVDPLPNGIRNEPVIVLFDANDVDRDGELGVEVHPAPGGGDPNVILNAIWIFPGDSDVKASGILDGSATLSAETIIPCGADLESGFSLSRLDLLTAELDGERGSPVAEIRSRRIFLKDEHSGVLRFEGSMIVATTPPAASVRKAPGGIDLVFPAGTRSVEVVVGFGELQSGRLPDYPSSWAVERQVKSWWIDSSSVPSGRIEVPDPAIQYLLDAGVRTMYQVRDRVDGLLQFQPGPSVYRGLWVGDVGVPWITALLLGDTSSTREYLNVLLRYQDPDGQVRVMTPVPSLVETPLLMFAIGQYARASGDIPWLEDRFEALENAVNWVRRARMQSLADPSKEYAGLLPPGFVDGGISTPATDFGSVFWAVIGIEHAIDAANMLDRQKEAREWAALKDTFVQSLHEAIVRDARPDSSGALFLPVTVGNILGGPPQRGMASQVFPIPFGKLYEHDTLLQRTVLGCLQTVDRHLEQGVPVGTGWLPEGLWPSWFGTFEVIAHGMYGDQDRGHGLLYAIANHATAAGSWAEEQLPRRMGPGTGGDMANAQSAAAFALAVRWWIARERADDLELFPAVPQEWLRAGAAIALKENSGRFGRFSVRCDIDSSGALARISVTSPDGSGSSGSVLVMLDAFRRAGFTGMNGEPLPARVVVPWKRTSVIELRR